MIWFSSVLTVTSGPNHRLLKPKGLSREILKPLFFWTVWPHVAKTQNRQHKEIYQILSAPVSYFSSACLASANPVWSFVLLSILSFFYSSCSNILLSVSLWERHMAELHGLRVYVYLHREGAGRDDCRSQHNSAQKSLEAIVCERCSSAEGARNHWESFQVSSVCNYGWGLQSIIPAAGLHSRAPFLLFR